MNSWLAKDSSQWTTRSARRTHQRLKARLRRGIGAALVMAMAILGLTMAPFAHAADTAATIEKTIVSPKSSYAIGDTVTYRLTLQCSSLTGSCGIGTITDLFDSHLTVTDANVFLPTSGTGGSTPPPLTKSVSGQTLTITVGNATTGWEDGKGFDVLVTATVNSYPFNSTPIGTIPNSAKVDITAGQGATADPVVINVTPPAKDWGLSKFKASPRTNPAPGELLTYEIHWTRPTKTSGVDITNATLTDVLDPRFEYVSSQVQYPGTGTPVTTYDAATHTLTISGLNMQANTRMNCDGSGCWSYTIVLVTVRVPPNAVDSTTPAPGTVFANTATSNVTYADGSTGILNGSTNVTIDAPNPALYNIKTGPASVPPGGSLMWRLYSANNGNTTLKNFQAVDSLPVDAAGNLMVENLRLVRTYANYQPLSPNVGTVLLEWSSDGVTWGSPTTIDASQPTPTTFAAPAGAKYIRFSVASLAPGQNFEIYVQATVPASTSLDASLTNCATYTATGATTAGPTCAVTTVDPPAATITPVKALRLPIAGQNSVQPGDVYNWVLGFGINSAIPVNTITMSDLLPPQFELVGVTCFTSAGTGSGIYSAVVTGGCPKYAIPAYTAVPQANGATLITFKDMTIPDVASQGSLGYGITLQVRVRPGTAIAQYRNEVLINTNDQVTKCDPQFNSGSDFTRPDTTDIDGDGNTTEPVCGDFSNVNVVEAAAVGLTKWDIGTKPNVFEATGTATPPAGSTDTACPDWNGYTRYPCVAVTDPGSNFSYRLRMQNDGNVPLTNYVMYDILPVVGDTGVGQLLSTGQRGTEWSPVMTGPLVFEPTLSTATNTTYKVEYNLTSNPCRPELNTTLATADQPWQASCNDVWYSAADIADWTMVKSFRVTMYQPAGGTNPVWAPGDTTVFTVPMKAPLSAGTSSLDPLDLSVAWNSAAQRSYRINAGGTTLWMTPTEPRKVGIIVPFTPPTGVSVGDYVWEDLNHDGKQDAGETPIADVAVTLYTKNADGTRTWAASTTTNPDGYYSFVNLTPDTDYIIEFTAPTNKTFTIVNATGDTSNSRDGDLTDSDAVPAADGKTGTVEFNSGPVGNNDPGGPTIANAVTDNPGLDAGFWTPPPAAMNLQLAKTGGTWTGLLKPGTEVTWTLTPNNAGTTDAIKGWSVTDLVPTGMEIVSMGGTGYSSCDITTDPTKPVCVADAGLAAGATGSPITVVTKVSAGWTGSAFTNVAYVDKAPTDVTETVPLVIPARDTDVTNPVTTTDNDASVGIHVVSVGDYVWWDTNRDGAQSTGEAVVAGVKVTLYAADGTTVVATTTTDANGFYSFTGLTPSTAYVIEFDKSSQPGASYTTPNAAGVTSNSATADLTDSDAAPADATTNLAKVSFTSQATGSNLGDATKADNPGIDAGLVMFNLTLTKVLTTAGPFTPGMTVTYTLTPSNDGPSTALAGWSVTDLLPAGLTLVSMTGTGYDCTTTPGTCVAGAALPVGAGNPITVTAKLDASFTGSAKNVAYVSPKSTDVPETVPLVVPTLTTDTTTAVTDNDAEAVLSVAKVSIGDYVWWDTNRNGQQDTGELPVPNVTVNLLHADGTPVLDAGGTAISTSTDGNGYYAFTDLLPGTAYLVEFVKPTGTVFTTALQGDTATDSNADVTTGRASVTTKTSGNNLADPTKADDPTIDAGLVQLVSVGDFVWWDTNRNGIQDTGEAVVPDGFVVKLYDANGTFLRDTTTTAGFYSFTDLMPGTAYTVEFVRSSTTETAAASFTTVDASGDTTNSPTADLTDSDADVTTGKVTFTTTDTGNNSGDPAAADNPGIDAGLVKYNLKLAKTLTTAGPYYPGMTVTYTVTPSNDGPADALAGWSVTDLVPTGMTLVSMQGTNYDCTTTPGTCVAAAALPQGDGEPITVTATIDAGFIGTARNVAYVSPSGDDVVPETNPLVVPVKDQDVTNPVTPTDNDAQAPLTVNPVSIGDYVWYDRNRDGQQGDPTVEPVVEDGMVVNLLHADGTPVLDAAGVARTTTTVGGYYAFTDLVPHTAYLVEFVKPANTVFTTALTGDVATDSNADVTTGRATVTTKDTGNNLAAPGQADDPTIDAGLVELVSVGDYVWWDTNRDGLQTAGEVPVAGITVNLLHADGTPVLDAAGVARTASTDANGYYWFTDLIAGLDYQVQFDKTSQPGAAYTVANSGGDTSNSATADLTDSDAVPADAASNLATVAFTAAVTGDNAGGANVADNPGIDAGLVKFNLTLAKVLDTAGPFFPGKTVTYTLTPTNEGPSTALAGWSVTDVLPAGLTLVSMSGTGYDCTTTPGTCVTAAALPAGAGAPITVTATLDATFTGAAKNVAYVSPSANDVPETNPLVVPTSTTDTGTSPTDNDAEAVVSVAKVSIGDYVWYDRNRDGQQGDPSVEPVVEDGMVVNLLHADGTPVLDAAGNPVTTTTVGGYYAFTDLLPHTAYLVEFVKPAGTVFTTALQGDSATDSNADVTTGRATVTTKDTGSNLAAPGQADDPTIDAGLVELVSVGDYVWWDTNRDGLQSAGEAPVAGVVVNLLNPDGTPVLDGAGVARTTVTDANGYYSFTNLIAGVDYVVQFDKTSQAGTAYTVPNAGGDTSNSATADLTDSDAVPADATSNLAAVAFTAAVTGTNSGDAGTADNPGIDAGLVKFNLVLAKTLTTAGPYYPGLTVTYTITPSNEGPADALAGWSVTDVLPTGLTLVSMTGAGYDCTTTPGTCVASAALPAGAGAPITVTATIDAGFIGTAKNVAYVSPSANDVPETNPLVVPTVTTDTGTSTTDNDAEATLTVVPVSIGDYVWYDRNRDGQQGDPTVEPVVEDGMVVNLLHADGTPVTDAAGMPVTTTTVGGYYAFTGLAPHTAYIVEFVKPANTVFTTALQGDSATDSNADVVTGRAPVTTADSGNNSGMPGAADTPTIDAGLVELVSIGDVVWWDTNRNGVQDAGELPVPGVTVNLLNPDGTAAVLPGGAPVTTTTDANGFYAFTNLLAGVTYQVQFVKPGNTIFTSQDATGVTSNDPATDGTDSDANEATGLVTVVAPITGTNSATTPDNPSIDAGLVKLVSVGDYVWWDTNLDGVQGDPTIEKPVAGVTVRLLDAAGNPAVLPGGAPVTTVTDANGYYAFTNLIGGVDYIIEFVKPAETIYTIANAGSDTSNSATTDVTDSDADEVTGRVAFTAASTGNNSAVPGQADNPGIDAGLVELVSVGDYVWMDTNRNGIQDAGEPPVSGVTVNLYTADGSLWDTTTTDNTGFYSFTDLLAGVDYVIEFVKPDGSAFTSTLTGADRAVDSNAPADGTVTFTAPATGNNSATTPDDPTIDAGLVVYNLTLVKKNTTTGTIYPGSTVTFTLTPHNEGPAAALAGWTVTDVLPGGLTLQSMTGDGYTCTGLTCTATSALPGNSDGPVITVTATVDAGFTGTITNLAYIAPTDKDVPETNPLGPIPGPGTNPATTPTDNDTDAPLTVEPKPLPHTGNDSTSLINWSLGLVALGMLLLAATRRRKDEDTSTTR